MSRIQGVFAGARAVLPQAVLEPLARRMPWREGDRHAVRESGTAVLAWTGAAGGGIAADDRFVVALDGRFYNAAELDRRLGSMGTGLRVDRSDADRLLELLRHYGLHETLPLLNGDFAIAVHDRREETFWLVRDRFGLKPLYYAPTSHGLFFASLPMPLAGTLGRPTVNPRFAAVFAGSHYRYFDNAAEESPFAGVCQVPRASVITIHADMSIRTKRWWSLTDAPDWTSSPEELAERYRELLLDSVGLRLSVARRPAFTLSGGMDSSTVLSCAAQVTGAGQTAFSAVYRDPTYDERADIAPMLGDRVEHWTPVAVDDVDVFSLVQRMVRIHGEPVATATWLSHFQLCAAVAAAGHDALFGGMGGDELNIGEYEYFPYFFADLLASGRDADFEQEVEAWIGHHDHPVFRKTRDAALAAVRNLTDSQNRGFNRLDQHRLSRYATAVLPDWFDLNQFVPVMEHPFRSHLRNRSWQDMTLETAPCCLRAEDRHTTFWGFERIDPFYDHRLAEFLFRVPIDQQIVQGVTKGLLRRATTGILPDETRQRVRKTGWNAPAHLWFSEGHPAGQLDDLIASRRFRERGLYDVRVVERLLDDHRAVVASGEARENHMMFLWQLLNLELWLQAVEEDEGGGSGAGTGRAEGGACVASS